MNKQVKQIKEVIERRIDNIRVSQKAGLIKKRDAEKTIFVYKDILSLINSLQENTTEKADLEKEVDNYLDNLIDEEAKSMFDEDADYLLSREDIVAMACHFVNWQKRKTVNNASDYIMRHWIWNTKMIEDFYKAMEY